MESIKALHIASFNGNIGDNANHNGFRRRLKETLKSEIVFTNLEMREFYQSWGLRNFNSQEFIKLCNTHDIVIFGGGNFFELKWDYSSTGTTIDLNDETIDAIQTPILFHGVGFDLAKGASQSAINKFENFLDKIIKKEDTLISFRNDGSYDNIQSLYGDKYEDDIIIVPDGAFFMETKQYDFPEIKEGYKYVGINVVNDMKDIRFKQDHDKDISYEEFINIFSKEMNTFLNENENYQLLFFPHIYSDLLSIHEVLNRLDDQNRRLRVTVAPLLTGPGSEEYIFGLYKHCEFIMGMRFHTNVSAIAQNIPTIALSSYKKINDVYNELGLEDRVVQINKANFQQELAELMTRTQKNVQGIKKKYQEVNEDVSEESLPFYNTVFELLN